MHKSYTKYCKALILLLSISFQFAYSQIIVTTPYPAAAQAITRGYSNSLLTVQVAWTSTCNNDTITIQLPTSVTYVLGSVTKTGGTQTISQGNMSNLRTPKFVVSNITGTGDITFTILRKAACGSLASGKDSIRVKGSCGTAQEISGTVNTYNIFAPSLSLNPPAPITNSVIRRLYTRSISVTNGGNGDADTVHFFIIYPSQGIVNSSGTNTITANSVNFMPWKTNGDTLFYKIFGATIFGGNNLLSNGESINITEPIRIAKCNTNTTYAAGWGTSYKNVCNYASGTSSVSMVTAVPNYSAVSSTFPGYIDECTPYDLNVTLTNGGTGNDTAAAMFDVKVRWGYCYTDLYQLIGQYHDLSITNGRINGNVVSTFTNTGSIGSMDINNLFNFDPDGAGGLEDLDGDGFFDDLRRGNSLTYTIRLTDNCTKACGADVNMKPGSSIEYRSMCASTRVESLCRSTPNVPADEYRLSRTTTGYVPANVIGGTPFRIKMASGVYINQSNYYNSNTRYRWFLKLPAGFAVSGSGNPKYGTASTTYTQSNDTIFITSSGNVRDTASINLIYTCGTGGTKTINYGLRVIQNISTGCVCKESWACGTLSTYAFCPGPCPSGPSSYPPVVRRTDGSLGWTNSTMSTRQVASAVSAYDLSKALYLDTILIIGSAKQNTNVNNLHMELTLGRSNPINKLTPVDIQVKIIRSGSVIANYNSTSFTDNSSGGTQIVDWDVSSGLPSGTMLVNDSVYSVSKYIVSDNATLDRQDIQNGGTWTHYSIITGTRQGCNTFVPEMYLVGTDIVDGRNGWSASGCNNVTDRNSYLARRFNTSGVLYNNEYRPVFYIDSVVVTFPPTYTIGTTSEAFLPLGNLTANRINGNVQAFYNPGTWPPVPLTVTNSYGAAFGYTMSPSCKSASNQIHNVKFYIRDYYYALVNKSTYPAAYKYVLGSGGGANILNNPSGYSQTITYSSVQKPILTEQNLTGTVIGTSPQHTWDIQLGNTGLSTAPYVWLALEKLTGSGITIDSVRSITTNATLTANNYGAGNSWYKITQAGIPIAGNHIVRVFFKYTSCNPDSILIRSGWNCTIWPITNLTADTNICQAASLYAKVIPNNSEVQLSVQRHPGNGSNISLCTTDSVIVQVNSAQSAYLVNPNIDIVGPTGTTISTPIKVEYPLGSGIWQNAVSSPITGGFNANLTSHTGIGANGIPGTTANPGATGRQAAVKIYYTTTCALTSGTTFSFKSYGNKPCGQPAIGNGVVTKSNGINITGAAVSGGMGVSVNAPNDTFRCSTPTRTLNLSSTPVISPTQVGDTVIYTLPAGLSYMGNFVTGANCATCTATSSSGPSNTTLVKVKLATGIAAGNTLVYSFDVKTNNSTGCTNTSIDVEARRQIAPLMCGGSPCANSSVVVGSQSKAITILKPNIGITTLNAGYPNVYPWYTYSYSVTMNNTGNDSLKTNSGYKLEFYFDNNNNNSFDLGIDQLVGNTTLTNPIAVGSSGTVSGQFSYAGSTPNATRAMFAVINTATNPNCNCTPLVSSAPVIGLSKEYKSFTATKQPNETVLLNWETAIEKNTTSFSVLRKLPGTDFIKIGTVSAGGNTPGTYSFTDLQTEKLRDVVYYKIAMNQTNSSVIETPVRAVVFGNGITMGKGFAFWPNPATNTLNILCASSEPSTYTITDNTGRVVKTGNIEHGFATVDVSSLSTGLLILTVNQNNNTGSEHLIIQK